MPQMAPLLWLNLFFMFLIGFILFFIMNYFMKMPLKIDPSSGPKPQLQKTWKW
uniref:ATP synthase complex subunit 8 n=1 Tax=Metanephrops thomsoni TaxID=360519 RepID=A0A0K0PS66_9EUCA|nr:ATP synthase F0 subunit 8 [Metanephrops thomsoni]AKQ49240.1 ATP synthase F0 subunit 8 [Metanephrops thomsoni]